MPSSIRHARERAARCAEAADLARQLPQLAENLAPLFEKLKSRLLALAERLPDGLGTGLRAGGGADVFSQRLSNRLQHA